MTSIEWLYAELANNNNSNDSIKERIYRQAQIWKDAKEMHKQEIIDAWNGGDYAYFYSKETGRDFADGTEYYNETFVSKGSDDRPMERKLLKSGFVDVVPKQEIPYNSPKEENKTSYGEISDEEIEDASLNIEHYNLDMIVIERIMWRKGAKWYREQLKQRQ
jgi:hypothetical protein